MHKNYFINVSQLWLEDAEEAFVFLLTQQQEYAQLCSTGQWWLSQLWILRYQLIQLGTQVGAV